MRAAGPETALLGSRIAGSATTRAPVSARSALKADSTSAPAARAPGVPLSSP